MRTPPRGGSEGGVLDPRSGLGAEGLGSTEATLGVARQLMDAGEAEDAVEIESADYETTDGE